MKSEPDNTFLESEYLNMNFWRDITAITYVNTSITHAHNEAITSYSKARHYVQHLGS